MSEIDVTETEQTPYLGCDNDVFSESFESHLDPHFKSFTVEENKPKWFLWSPSF